MNKKDQNSSYSLHVHARSFPVTDAIYQHVLEKIESIEKFTHDVIDVKVSLDKQKLDHFAFILIQAGQTKIHAKAVAENVYVAIDKAVTKLKRLIKKYEAQLKDHKAPSAATIDLNVNVIAPAKDATNEVNIAIEEENWLRTQGAYQLPELTPCGKLKVRMLTQQEALMTMDLSSNHFMVYKSEEDQKFKVIYRRDNQSFGLIEIEIPG